MSNATKTLTWVHLRDWNITEIIGSRGHRSHFGSSFKHPGMETTARPLFVATYPDGKLRLRVPYKNVIGDVEYRRQYRYWCETSPDGPHGPDGAGRNRHL